MISKRHFLTASAGLAAASAGVWLANERAGAELVAQPPATGIDLLWQLKLPTAGGQELPLASFKGKPLFINFWATWCAPCVEEMPMLDQFYRQHAAIGLQMLGIAADKAVSVDTFLNRSPLSFPIVLAGFEGISISKQLGNESGGLPHSLFLDAKGAVLFEKKGQLTTDELTKLSSTFKDSVR